MIQTRDDLIESLKGSGATGSPVAMVSHVWDILNLPGAGSMVKIGGVVGPKIIFDTKGIQITIRIMDTTENVNAVMAMKHSGAGIAIITQEPDPGEEENPNQTQLPLGEGDLLDGCEGEPEEEEAEEPESEEAEADPAA